MRRANKIDVSIRITSETFLLFQNEFQNEYVKHCSKKIIKDTQSNS